MSDTEPPLSACPRCGLVQILPALEGAERALCVRCEAGLDRSARRSRQRARALALAALILLPVAVCLPLVRIEKFGRLHEASLLSGTVSLLAEGPLIVGLLVAICSLLLPAVKLLVIFLLSRDASRLSPRARLAAHHLVELAGRWGLLDVLLVAVLLATLKLRGLVEIQAGAGALAFSLCVMLNVWASSCLHPRDFWEDERS